MHRVKENVATKTRLEIKEPARYKVVLFNDDYTTMDFVVMVLMVVFHKTLQDAQRIMLSVHCRGKAVCGIYVYEAAETKVAQVSTIARQHRFPLQCAVEEE